MFLKYLSVFLISMVPLIELRAAVPIAIGMGLDTLPSIAVCALGNMAPVPIIYLFARKFLVWGLDKPGLSKICHFFHDKGEAAGKKLSSSRFGKYGLVIALALFVGIPLPGTGAWTGTLGASFLDLGFKKTVFAVLTGVFIAAGIMTTVSLLGVNILGL